VTVTDHGAGDSIAISQTLCSLVILIWNALADVRCLSDFPMNFQPRSFLWIDKDLRSQSLSNCKKDAAGRGAIDLHIQAWRSEARRLPSKVITERLKDSGGCKCREGVESPQAYGECMC
jgi:hypothetical protein